MKANSPASDFEAVKQAIKDIGIDTLRLDEEKHFEAVVLSKDLDKITGCLEMFFERPLFPSQNQLSGDIAKLIAPFGGIMPGQNLYYSHKNNQTVIVMLWPWSNGKQITLKLLKV